MWKISQTLLKEDKTLLTKDVFSFNNAISKQTDSASMRSCLGLVLGNIIMTEVETVIVDKLLAGYLLKFYIHYSKGKNKVSVTTSVRTSF